MVVLNKIYTKTGDAGETALGNGVRVAKHSSRVNAYGTVDEVNATVGLARLLRSAELTPVWTPDLPHEAMRDLVRARAASKEDATIARQRIQSMLLRCARKYDGKSWTKRHRNWLANQSFPLPSQQVTFQHYIQALEQCENRTAQLEAEILRLLPEWSLGDLVIQLQALRGVALIVAVTIVAEVGDFTRFSNPKQLMAYLGLIPGEHSSGGKVRPRVITKVGNSEARRMLYEAAWSYRTNAKVGSWMLARGGDATIKGHCLESAATSLLQVSKPARKAKEITSRDHRSGTRVTRLHVGHRPIAPSARVVVFSGLTWNTD